MLKTTLAAGLTTLTEVGNKNPEQGDKGIKVENRDKKELAQKSCKNQSKDQKMAKSKK